MLSLPARSPFDGGEIVVTRFYCPGSDVTVEGRFAVTTPFPQLSQEQLRFVEIFLKCEGKLNRMEGELGLSYPTIRSRLLEIIRALGYEPGKDEATIQADRRSVLDELDSGAITFEEAMSRLRGES
ncbi:MAG: DUF2089 domain-containing protein [Chloroflexota bacterium]|nr:DUF2089 domain-containing protein [Chloroflexota bacterium]